MAAVRYQAVKQGGPFETVPTAKPKPGENEVVVHVEAVGLNPIDYKRLDYGLYVPSWPITFGSDGAGVVEAVGAGVQHVHEGDDVLAHFESGNERGAAFQSYAALDASRVAPKPKSLSFEEAAALPTTYITAAGAIYNDLKIPLTFLPGGSTDGYQPNSVLVLGGSSGVGAAAIQLLRLVLPQALILATGSSQHHPSIKSLGADEVFDYRSKSPTKEIKQASPNGQGVEVIIDAVNSVALDLSLFEVLTGPKHFAEVATGQNVKEVPEGIQHHLVLGAAVYGAPGAKNLIPVLTKLVEEGKYKVPTAVTVVGKGFDAIDEGLQILQKGVSRTKLVVTV